MKPKKGAEGSCVCERREEEGGLGRESDGDQRDLLVKGQREEGFGDFGRGAIALSCKER